MLGELKPCPFCLGINHHREGCYIALLAEHVNWSSIDEEELNEAWNMRAEHTCTMEYNLEYSADEFYPTMAFECSECGHVVIDGIPNYCPNCGAKVME